MIKRYKAENFRFEEGKEYESARGGVVWFDNFLPPWFEKIEYGNLFAYMYRRFGIPQMGSDDHKEIAAWCITTPDPGIGLRVSPKPSGVVHGLGYIIDAPQPIGRFDKAIIKHIEAALLAAINDLLIPVYVRDVAINAIGIVDEHRMKHYDHHEWAGYGVSLKYFEDNFGETQGAKE